MSPPMSPPARKLLTAVALSTAPLFVACGSDSGSTGFIAGTDSVDSGDDATTTIISMGTLIADAGVDDAAILNAGDAGDDTAADASDDGPTTVTTGTMILDAGAPDSDAGH